MADLALLQQWNHLQGAFRRLNGRLLDDVEARTGVAPSAFQALWYLVSSPEYTAKMSQLSGADMAAVGPLLRTQRPADLGRDCPEHHRKYLSFGTFGPLSRAAMPAPRPSGRPGYRSADRDRDFRLTSATESQGNDLRAGTDSMRRHWQTDRSPRTRRPRRLIFERRRLASR